MTKGPVCKKEEITCNNEQVSKYLFANENKIYNEIKYITEIKYINFVN